MKVYARTILICTSLSIDLTLFLLQVLVFTWTCNRNNVTCFFYLLESGNDIVIDLSLGDNASNWLEFSQYCRTELDVGCKYVTLQLYFILLQYQTRHNCKACFSIDWRQRKGENSLHVCRHVHPKSANWIIFSISYAGSHIFLISCIDKYEERYSFILYSLPKLYLHNFWFLCIYISMTNILNILHSTCSLRNCVKGCGVGAGVRSWSLNFFTGRILPTPAFLMANNICFHHFL